MRRKLKTLTFSFIDFGLKEALACLFPVLILGGLMVSNILHIPYRYDWLFAYALIIQICFYLFGLETINEIKVICLFHLLGLAMEIFKVSHGIWSYPDPSFLRIMGVPLYSGFMYAAVASYMMQSWKLLKLRVENWPKTWIAITLAVIIYMNFFTNMWFYDIRYWILLALPIIFFRSKIYFTVYNREYRMPVIASFGLIAIFIWIAENFGTFFNAWQYNTQASGWHIVNPSIYVSWILLVILSMVIVITFKLERRKSLKHLYTPKPIESTAELLDIIEEQTKKRKTES